MGRMQGTGEVPTAAECWVTSETFTNVPHHSQILLITNYLYQVTE